jgi:hypothetical protein
MSAKVRDPGPQTTMIPAYATEIAKPWPIPLIAGIVILVLVIILLMVIILSSGKFSSR